MKTRIVLAGFLATLTVLEVSAQRPEYDDMYFRGKDREKNKAISADRAFASAKQQREVSAQQTNEDYYGNPTDSYSGRNVNPEYVSRSNSERVSDDEANYYSENYQPQSTSNFNNSYYNNANWASNSYYAGSMRMSPFYGGYGMYDPWMGGYGMNPYYGGGFYDPWMMPSYGYGYGSGYGWRSGWSLSMGYGGFASPWGYGYGGYGFGNAYYGGHGGGYGYPGYYSGAGHYENSRVVNYGKRPSQHSAVITPDRTRQRPQQQMTTGNNNYNTRPARARQSQGDYYVRPSRRTSFDNSASPYNNSRSHTNTYSTPSSRPARSGDFGMPQSRPSYSPSPSRSSGGSMGGGGGRPSGGGGGGGRPRGGH